MTHKKLHLALLLACLVLVSLACSLFEAGVETVVPPAATAAPQAANTQAVEPTTESPTQPVETAAPPSSPTPAPPAALAVAYIKDGNVWLWQQATGSRPLTSTGNVSDVALSDDGLVAAFTRQVDELNSELWAVNKDGSAERRLASLDEMKALVGSRLDANASGIAPFQIGWKPGTHLLAFNTRPVFDGPGLIGYDDLYLVDTDTLEKKTLLESGQGGMFHYSPDGSYLAVVTSTSIHLMPAEGGAPRLLLQYPQISTYSEYLYYPTPIWASEFKPRGCDRAAGRSPGRTAPAHPRVAHPCAGRRRAACQPGYYSLLCIEGGPFSRYAVLAVFATGGQPGGEPR